MTVVEVERARREERPVLAQLFELYAYYFSEIDGADVDADGRYGFEYLERYWVDADRHPFLLRVDGRLAGFALVRSGDPHDMAEFFVMRKYRRHGAGRQAARDVFARFPGHWQVRVVRGNDAAVHFWHTAIPVPFVEAATAEGSVRRFDIA